MATSKVDIQVGVQGAEAAVSKLENLGATGAAATEKIRKGGQEASGGLAAVEKASELVHAKVNQLAESAGPLGDILTKFGPSGFAAAAGLGAMVAGLTHALGEADGFERRMLKIEAVLNATGGASGKTAAQIADLGDRLEATTLATGDSVELAATKLLAYRSIAGDVFDQTLVLAQDLSAVGFGGLAENAVKLGKALEDPAAGLEGLSRIGIVFSDQLKEQIKDLQENGESLKAQRLIIEEVTARVGGAGVAERNTLSGAWHGFTEQLNNSAETLGVNSGLLGTFRDMINGVTGALKDYSDAFMTARGELAELERRLERDSGAGWSEGHKQNLRDQIAELQKFIKIQDDAAAAEERLRERQAKAVADERDESKQRADMLADITSGYKQFETGLKDAITQGEREVQTAARLSEQRAKTITDLEFQADAQRRLFAVVGASAEVQDRVNLQLEIETNLRKLAAGATEDQRQKVIELTTAEHEAKKGIEDYKDAQEALEKAQKKASDEALRAAELQEKQLKKLNDQVLKFAQEMSVAIVDSFVGMLEGSKNPLDGLVNYAKRIFKEIAAAAIITPVIQPIIASAVAAGATMLGGTAAAASGGGAVGGMSNLLGAGSSLYTLSGGSAGMFSGIGAGVASYVNGLGASSGLFGGSLAAGMGPGGVMYGSIPGLGSATAMMPATQTAGLLGGTASLTSVLGAGAIGALGGNVLAGLLGLNKTGGSIGGGLGAAIGMMTPLGPLGALLGGAAGSVLGGLFGGKPSNKSQGYEVDLGDFSTTWTGDQAGGKKYDAANRDEATKFVDNFRSFVQGITAATGGRLDIEGGNSLGVVVGSRDGTDVRLGGLGTKNFESTAEAMKYAVDTVVASLKDVPDNVKSAMGKIDWTGDLQTNLSLIEFAKNFDDTIQTMLKGSLDPQKDAFIQAQRVVESYVAQIKDFKKTTADLGLSTVDADRATRSFVERLVGITAAADEQSPLAKTIDDIKGTFSAIGPLLEEVGISADKAGELLAGALAKVTAGFNQSIADQILQIKDPKAYELAVLDRTFEQIRKDAELAGADMNQVEELYQLRRKQIVEKYAKQITTIVEGAVATLEPLGDTLSMVSELYDARIEQLSDEAAALEKTKEAWQKVSAELKSFSSGLLINSSLSPLGLEARRNEALSQLQGAYGRLLGGDPTAAGDVKSLSTAFLTLEKEFSRSSSQYTASFDMVRGMLATAQQYAGRQVSIDDLQLKVLQDILATLRAERGAIGGAAAGPSYNVADQSMLVGAYTAARGNMTDAEFMATSSGQLWVTARNNLISGISDPALLAQNAAMFAAQRNQAGLGDVGQSGLDATIAQMRKLGLDVPSFDGGGWVRQTGMALVHEGEAVVRTKGGQIPVDNSGLTARVDELVAMVDGLVRVSAVGQERMLAALEMVATNTGRTADAGDAAKIFDASAGRSRVLAS